MKITAIITAYKESRTIGRAIEAIAKQVAWNDEIIVVAPDSETLNESRKFAKRHRNLSIIQDEGKGKPAALNLAVSKAEGDILILSDGDVYAGNDSIKFLIDKLKDKNIGAVSGSPVSLNPKNNMLGFWAHVLTKVADERRKTAVSIGKRFFCSGYLFAIRRRLFPKLPEELLSEDGYISHKVYDAGYRIAYSPESEVYVKYPDNFSDWIKQKKRSAGGYNQIQKLLGVEMRSFKKESSGIFGLFKYVSNIQELFWLFELFLARVYLWAAIYFDINLRKKSQKELWKRIESTK